jgi:hypothetical protein
LLLDDIYDRCFLPDPKLDPQEHHEGDASPPGEDMLYSL